MEFGEVVRKRRMVRNYDPDRPVPAEVVDRLLGHATHAPSAGFSQGWGFLVLDEPADRDAFWAATTPPGWAPSGWLEGMSRAPLIVVPHSNRSAYLDRYAEADKGWTDRDEARWPVPYWDIDTGMASLLMLLTAVDEGLGACFFGIPSEKVPAARTEFAIPDAFDPVGTITLGHPAATPGAKGSPSRRRRKDLDEVVHRGTWSTPG
jgi:nitroreductase